MPSVDVRPIRPQDLAAVQQMFRSGGDEKHSVRLARQEAGEACYLTAWLDGDPVGHAFLLWAGPDHDDLLLRLPRTTLVEDLVVHPDLRGRGIGTCLLQRAESLTRLRSIPHLSLGVADGNTAARRLYERLGFRDAGIGPFMSRWVEPGPGGEARERSELVSFLTKRLAIALPG